MFGRSRPLGRAAARAEASATAVKGVERPSGRGRRLAVALGGSLLVAGCFAWLLRRGTLPILPAKDILARVPWWVAPAYGAIWLVVLLLRSIRWYWLLRPLHPVT